METKKLPVENFEKWCLDYVRREIDALVEQRDFKAVVDKYYRADFPLVDVFAEYTAGGYIYNDPKIHTPETALAPICNYSMEIIDECISEAYEDFVDANGEVDTAIDLWEAEAAQQADKRVKFMGSEWFSF